MSAELTDETMAGEEVDEIMGGESIEEELGEEMLGMEGVDKEMLATEGETLVGMEEEGENAEIYTDLLDAEESDLAAFEEIVDEGDEGEDELLPLSAEIY